MKDRGNGTEKENKEGEGVTGDKNMETGQRGRSERGTD